jgi:predicted nucleic acid-binding protein
VATRPTQINGLGLSVRDAEAQAADFEKAFTLLDEIPAIFPIWKSIVESLGVIGKQVHDARLVAICHAHKVSSLMTFNVAHFSRLTASPQGVSVINPASVK